MVLSGFREGIARSSWVPYKSYHSHILLIRSSALWVVGCSNW